MDRKALMRLAIDTEGAVGSATFGPGASILASTVKEMPSRHLSDKEAERTTFCMVAAAKKSRRISMPARGCVTMDFSTSRKWGEANLSRSQRTSS